jgi:hypothetical protein
MWAVVYQNRFRTPRVMGMFRSEEKAQEECAWCAFMGAFKRYAVDMTYHPAEEMSWRKENERYQSDGQVLWVVEIEVDRDYKEYRRGKKAGE